MNLKNKVRNKQDRNRVIDMKIIWNDISGVGKGENGGKGAGIKKYKLVGTKWTG